MWGCSIIKPKLYVFDLNLKRLGIVSNYDDAFFERKYTNHSQTTIVIPSTQKTRKLFFSGDTNPITGVRIVARSDDLQRGYIVSIPEYIDEKTAKIQLLCRSLSYLLKDRLIVRQRRLYGNVEQSMRTLVDENCINTTPNRIMPRLTLGTLRGITDTADLTYSNKQLDEALWEICKKYECSYEILMNHVTKQLEFVVVKGADRSDNQRVNKRICFAKSFKNILNQSYVDDNSNYRSTAYVGGEGEGIDRAVTVIGDESSGYARKEVFIDARDIQSEYYEDGVTVTIPPSEYETLLIERGESRLQDYRHIQTFESNVNPNSSFKYGIDYFLGDIVSVKNDDLGIVAHTRVVIANERFNKSGYHLDIQFGEAIPTLIDKIKREAKK